MGEIEQRELKLWIDNDYHLYKQRFEPIIKNLVKKKKKGTYNQIGAVRLFQYLVVDGAKRYAKENANPSDWNTMFSTKDRLSVAREYEKEFEQEYKYGNYENLK